MLYVACITMFVIVWMRRSSRRRNLHNWYNNRTGKEKGFRFSKVTTSEHLYLEGASKILTLHKESGGYKVGLTLLGVSFGRNRSGRNHGRLGRHFHAMPRRGYGLRQAHATTV